MAGRFSRFRGWGLRLIMVALAVAWLALIAAAWAERDAHAAEGKSDEYNFSWLDPEKKIYVLQNRKFLKADRLMLSATVGTGFSNPYRFVIDVDPRVGFFLSEAWGIEAMYNFELNTPNSVVQALAQAAPTAAAVVREVRSEYGLLVDWVPWYAKINVFNTILYFDWYFEGGGGAVHTAVDTAPANQAAVYTESDTPAAFLGTGHMFHLTRALTVRIDFLGAFYLAPIFGTSGSNAVYSDYKINIGLGWRI